MRKVDSSEEGNKYSRANNSHAFYPLTCSLVLANKLTSSYRKGPNFFRAKAPYLTVVSFCKTYIQLFRERLSEKMCTRQSRKVTERRSGIRLLFAGYSRNTVAVCLKLIFSPSEAVKRPPPRGEEILFERKSSWTCEVFKKNRKAHVKFTCWWQLMSRLTPAIKVK